MLFHFDRANEEVPRIFPPDEVQAVQNTILTAMKTLPNPNALAVLAVYAHAAIPLDFETEFEQECERCFFDILSDLGVDIASKLASLPLRASVVDRINAGFESLRTMEMLPNMN
jgi:hypothetical protein